MEKTSICKKIGRTEYNINPLQGRKREIVDYAATIASLDPTFSSQYVMAFDYDEDPLWTVNPGDTDFRDMISWDGVKRVEIWDYSHPDCDGHRNCFESMYYTTKKSLEQYLDGRGLK